MYSLKYFQLKVQIAFAVNGLKGQQYRNPPENEEIIKRSKKIFKFLFNLPIGSYEGRNLKKEGDEMSASISGITAYGGELFAHAAATPHEATAKAHPAVPNRSEASAETDTVDLSASVKARIMKGKGDSTDKIAERLGVDVKTVESYLGSNTVPTETMARQMKQKGESVSRIANLLNVDVKTVERYIGSGSLSSAHLARQLKENGESAAEIAKKLHLDVKSVNIYLGIPPAPLDEQAQQLKEEGESVIKIANNLHLDVKTVNMYLGIPPKTDEKS